MYLPAVRWFTWEVFEDWDRLSTTFSCRVLEMKLIRHIQMENIGACVSEIKKYWCNNKGLDSLSVEKSFNWNYSFITEKEKLYKSLCRMPKGLTWYQYINNHWFISSSKRQGGRVAARSWQWREVSLQSMITQL